MFHKSPGSRAVLLDIDGTLLDSNDAHAMSLDTKCPEKRRGHAFSATQTIRPLHREGRRQAVLPSLTGTSRPTISEEGKAIDEARRTRLFFKELSARVAQGNTAGARALLEMMPGELVLQPGRRDVGLRRRASGCLAARRRGLADLIDQWPPVRAMPTAVRSPTPTSCTPRWQKSEACPPHAGRAPDRRHAARHRRPPIGGGGRARSPCAAAAGGTMKNWPRPTRSTRIRPSCSTCGIGRCWPRRGCAPDALAGLARRAALRGLSGIGDIPRTTSGAFDAASMSMHAAAGPRTHLHPREGNPRCPQTKALPCVRPPLQPNRPPCCRRLLS